MPHRVGGRGGAGCRWRGNGRGIRSGPRTSGRGEYLVSLADSGRRQPVLEEIGDPFLDHERFDLGKRDGSEGRQDVGPGERYVRLASSA
jgi:hypothetical protein